MHFFRSLAIFPLVLSFSLEIYTLTEGKRLEIRWVFDRGGVEYSRNSSTMIFIHSSLIFFFTFLDLLVFNFRKYTGKKIILIPLIVLCYREYLQ